MSKVTIYDLEAALPLYVLDVLVKGSLEVEIGQFETDLGERQGKLEQENIHKDIADEDDPIPDWVKLSAKTGRFGELIALSYLQRSFPGNVEPVWSNAKMGYDIAVKRNNLLHAYEVKTTSNNNNKFYITHNELKVAEKLRDCYHIFFIKIDSEEKTITGFILDNPIETLSINFSDLTKVMKLVHIDLSVDRFIVNMNENFVASLRAISLLEYIPMDEH
ncbi:DUF3883 domain-containing protein [Paenibacillus sp. GYB003]|uniref:DUF3883 domain-containing protein n=1 Tax=Paenibacillus sp. GYB003 TaxID=2994392 RepID=UPI002F9661F7